MQYPRAKCSTFTSFWKYNNLRYTNEFNVIKRFKLNDNGNWIEQESIYTFDDCRGLWTYNRRKLNLYLRSLSRTHMRIKLSQATRYEVKEITKQEFFEPLTRPEFEQFGINYFINSL